ncbi:hypothetical protein V6N11_061055 [Hibiscus sabdariffa]|uniref:Uncharacterized protein n=1 Tax=Hibiscus sabdariffa TaxID=183260 RepID=A0ABR2QS19_9ROSI
MAKTVTPVVPVVSSDVVYVPEVPSEVVVPVSGVGDSTVSGVVGPTTTDFGKVAIVEGTTASASVKGGKHPWNPLISTEAITFFEKLLGAKDSMVSSAPVELLKELLGVIFSDAAKDAFQRRVCWEGQLILSP